ncbi:5-formyltetrahydrofolate cyclo-ligase [Bacillus atrophaeus]|uniref:5-formyltetrahydrofolate cyclo-ligase n=1 Tax=Bacillus atrophaeus TaxID=1452 RepID=UPI00240DED8B|nr:5-formyltetrahydrofolate cyclo-ligase [Bacillus atrophaeus]
MKTQLRKAVKEQLSAVSDIEWLQKSAIIHQRLFSLQEWQEAQTIAVTISRGQEIPTGPLIQQAWEEGKQVCIPKCFPDTRDMQFRTYKDGDQLETVYVGLQEPITEKNAEVKSSDIDVMIVPGVCFDHDGYRIGYGGGYYDRYLEGYNGSTVSLLLSCQLVASIPRMPHDIPVKKLITDNKIVDCFS